MDYETKIKQVKEWIEKAQHVVIMTGAGMSAESGVDTFRGKTRKENGQVEEGVWEGWKGKMQLSYFGTQIGWRLSPQWAWRMYVEYFYEPMAYAEPHKGYHCLVRWKKENIQKEWRIITQNVDGLHQRSGWPPTHMVELHGSVHRYRCIPKGHEISIQMISKSDVPRCTICKGHVRPDVILFLESLKEDVWNEAMSIVSDLTENDVVLIIGTSAIIQPAASLPSHAKLKGAKVVEINVEPSAMTSKVDMFLQGKAGDVLEDMDRILYPTKTNEH